MEYFTWNIEPYIFKYGSLQLRWYGVLFISSFALGFLLIRWIYRRENRDLALAEILFYYMVIGAIVGSRLMHCFAYQPDYFLSHPFEIVKFWNGGLASHGGMLGEFLVLWIFARRYDESYLWLISRMTIPGTLTATFVRFGNFFNSEIVGKPTDLPWAIIFEHYDMVPRHPVQLYEAFSYLILFALLVWLYKKIPFPLSTRLLTGVFLTYMFMARFLLEYTKTKQTNYTLDIPFTTGQLLSIPFILIGIVWIIWVLMTGKKQEARSD